MFLETKGSTKYQIKGIYTVYIPPMPDKESIRNYGLSKEQQYFRRTKLPDFYSERLQEELFEQEKEKKLVDAGQLDKVRYFDSALEKFRRTEWERRIYGFWFYNNGIPIYITGEHYFFLNWCKFDHPENDGYPLFYMPQVDRFYFRELCKTDPYSLGYILVGPRGFGKTSEEVAGLLNDMTMPPHRRTAAIQSKSERDAINVIFKGKMVPVFNELPHFFKPEYSHGSDPQKALTFRRDAKKGAAAKKVKYGEEYELQNTINCVPAKEKALDGDTLANIINDEIGKTDPKKEADVNVRMQVNIKSVFRNRVKRGIIRATTTVEEMDKGGDECHKIWLGSNPAEYRDENGQTRSKLYKFFVNAIDARTEFSDKHGVIDEKMAMKNIMAERKAVEHDPDAYASLLRKDPLSEDEAFIPPQDKCLFDVLILTEVKKFLESLEGKPGVPCKLEWDVKDKLVVREPHPDGGFMFYRVPDFKEGLRMGTIDRIVLNSTVKMTDPITGKMKFFPRNSDLFRSGIDPIKSVRTEDPRASKLAKYTMMNYNPNLDHGMPIDRWISHNILYRYFKRSKDPLDDYENIVKAMFYTGAPAMVEDNTTDLNGYIRTRGYDPFLIEKRDFDEETFEQNRSSKGGEYYSSTPEVINTYVSKIKTFIIRHGMRIPDIELISQLFKFDSKKPTAHDLVVALGYALMAMSASIIDPLSVEQEIEEIESLFNRYDVSGQRSKLIKN